MNKNVKFAKAKRIALWLAVAAIMCTIFTFSSENAGKSTATSDGIIESVLELIDPEFKNLTPTQKEKRIDTFSFSVRKSAHFAIYCLLGIMSCAVISKYTDSLTYMITGAIGISMIYAISDEIHQYFVPGRSCELRDVLIDTAGALLGAALFTVTSHLRKRLRREGRGS